MIHDTELLLIGSMLMGMDHAATHLELTDDINSYNEVPAIPFEDAVKLLKSRVPMTKSEWTALEPKLRFRAFTVARLSQVDSIETIRTKLIATMDKGGTCNSFWADADLQNLTGFDASSPWYWETVHRTNVQTCYNAGRAMEFQRNQPEYLEFLGIEDVRQTEICAVRSGVIRPATDRWWATNWAPLHFCCRSTIRGIYRNEVDAIRATNPHWGPTSDNMLTRDPPAEGFGGNPIETESFWKLTPTMIQRADKFNIEDELQGIAKSLGISDFSMVNVSGKTDFTKAFEIIKNTKLRNYAISDFKNAPKELKHKVIINQEEFTYFFDPNAPGSYHSNGKIVINNMVTPDVFSHEFGHALDRHSNWFSMSSPEMQVAFTSDLARLISSKTGKFLKAGKQVIAEKSQWEDIPAISDCFAGLTHNKIYGNWWHDNAYWARAGADRKEVFANLLSIYALGDEPLWSQASYYFPKLCKVIEGYIKQ